MTLNSVKSQQYKSEANKASRKEKGKAGRTEESPQLINHPRLSGKTIIPQNTTAAQVTSPIDDESRIGIKRSVDELAAPKYNEQNFSDADLEEGEIKSPSPVANKKQKTAASSAPGIKPRPRSPRRRKSPSKKAQVPVRKSSPREPSPEPIRRGTLSRREPYRRESSRRDSSIDSTNRSKSPLRREYRRDTRSPQRRRSRSPARRDSRRGISPVSTSRNKSPVRQSLPTRDTSSVLPVRRSQETQNHTSSTALKQKQPLNASSAIPVRHGEESNNQASSSAPNQKQPMNASPAIPVHPVENSGNPASFSALSDKEKLEQYRIFKIMLGNHARTTKHRGDKRKETKAGILDLFHSLCSCIISFYYEEKLGKDSTMETMTKWKSLFKLIGCLLYHMDGAGMSELRSLCQRLKSLIRFHIYELLETTRPATQEEDRQQYDGVSSAMSFEHEKADEEYNISKSSVGFALLKRFEDVCLVGDLKSGMILNNEDGGASAPFVPFGIKGPLHLAAIAARCILNEYMKSSDIDYSPIVDYRDFM